MAFKKGQPRPPGAGRKPNGQSPNKTTAQMQRYISAFLAEYQDSGDMMRDFASLEPKDKLLIAEKFASYVMPKRQAVDGNIDITTSQSAIDDTLAALAEENEH